MAAGKAIVAARAAAIPEVAPHATLVEPESADAIAEGILDLFGSPERRSAQIAQGKSWVEQFDAPRVARCLWLPLPIRQSDRLHYLYRQGALGSRDHVGGTIFPRGLHQVGAHKSPREIVGRAV